MRRAGGLALVLALSLLLTGCAALLERSYSTAKPHSAAYWENADADTLRAEGYQELVNALLLLVGEHAEDGTVRFYGAGADAAERAGAACAEVQRDTALGAYLLDYITYDGEQESGYYTLSVHLAYRRTAEEQGALVNATSPEALPDLLRAAVEDGRGALAMRVAYFTTDRAGVLELVRGVYEELYPPEEEPEEPPAEELPAEEPPEGTPDETVTETPDEPSGEADPADAEPSDGGQTGDGEPQPPEWDLPWEVCFYPNDGRPGIIEVILHEKTPDA